MDTERQRMTKTQSSVSMRGSWLAWRRQNEEKAEEDLIRYSSGFLRTVQNCVRKAEPDLKAPDATVLLAEKRDPHLVGFTKGTGSDGRITLNRLNPQIEAVLRSMRFDNFRIHPMYLLLLKRTLFHELAHLYAKDFAHSDFFGITLNDSRGLEEKKFEETFRLMERAVERVTGHRQTPSLFEIDRHGGKIAFHLQAIRMLREADGFFNEPKLKEKQRDDKVLKRSVQKAQVSLKRLRRGLRVRPLPPEIEEFISRY